MSIEFWLGILSLVGVIGSTLIADRRFAKRDATSALEIIIKTLQSEQSSLRDDNRELRKEIDVLRNELAKAQRRITELESENYRLRDMLKNAGRL